jgi:hypothetical protein
MVSNVAMTVIPVEPRWAGIAESNQHGINVPYAADLDPGSRRCAPWPE